MKDFPHSKLIVMATLDTIQFAGLTVSAAGISPAMTVILLHTSTPFLVLGSRYAFPDRKYSVIQMRGVQLIALSVLISLVGSMTHLFLPGVHESDTASSLLYFSMSALHGKIDLHSLIMKFVHPLAVAFRVFLISIIQFRMILCKECCTLLLLAQDLLLYTKKSK